MPEQSCKCLVWFFMFGEPGVGSAFDDGEDGDIVAEAGNPSAVEFPAKSNPKTTHRFIADLKTIIKWRL